MNPKSIWHYFVLCWMILPLSTVTAAPLQQPEIECDADPLDIEILKNPGSAWRKSQVITADTIEEFPALRRSMPSLWWTQDQLGQNIKLVDNWLVYPAKRRIDLVIRPQFWNNLEYTERYQLINRYGTVARYYGYNVRIFNPKYDVKKPIVAYTCNHGTTPLTCSIQWQENSLRAIRVNTSK
jgi:hypothetical protein